MQALQVLSQSEEKIHTKDKRLVPLLGNDIHCVGFAACSRSCPVCPPVLWVGNASIIVIVSLIFSSLALVVLHISFHHRRNK